MARTSVTIVLELDETTDSLSGSAGLPDGTSREFHGWLGLTEAIDALVRANGTAPVVVSGGGAGSGLEESPSRALDNTGTRRRRP